MEHKGTLPLETERLLLRRFVLEDREAFYRHCISDYEVWRWTNYPRVDSLGEMQSKAGLFTPNWLDAYRQPNRYSWAITLKGEGEAIGRMFGMHPDDRTEDVELAYELSREFWGRGLMTEAVRAALGFFFGQVGFYRVHCYHASENPASGRVMQKCGMRWEGTMKEACVCNGGRYDQANYAMLCGEWAESRSYVK